MNYTIEAKPTQYKGVQFRSRLEAHWAAFFDMLDWPWVYEPLDIGGWSPDFLIRGTANIFVEVKPILEFQEDIAKRMEINFLQYIKEYCRPPWNRAWNDDPTVNGTWCETLLLGLAPFVPVSEYDYGMAIGWSGEVGNDMMDENGTVNRGPFLMWDHAIAGVWKDRWGYANEQWGYRDRISGVHWKCLPGPEVQEAQPIIEGIWHSAGNVVQWKANGETNNGHNRTCT